MVLYKSKFFAIICLSFSILLFIPEKTSAQYTEKDIYAYIDQYKEVAIQKMYEYKIPASITIAQGIFESACGKSHLAADGNNHFGIKCHQDWTGDTILIDDDELQECFRKYDNAMDSYTDHSLYLTNKRRYANLFQLDIMDYASWARTLKADGYATNPQYADRLIGLIERLGLAQLDTLYQERLAAGYFTGDTTAIVADRPVKPQPTLAEKPKPTLAEKINQPAKVEKVETKPVTRPTPTQPKVFTAIGNDYPAGNSPFSYRKVFENNHTYFVIAKKGDTYETIAEDVQVDAESLRKFNDVDKATNQPVENEIVYVEAKAKNNITRIHTVQAGETLRYIAQRYGVQLHYIFKYNNLDEKSIIHPGDQIVLKH